MRGGRRGRGCLGTPNEGKERVRSIGGRTAFVSVKLAREPFTNPLGFPAGGGDPERLEAEETKNDRNPVGGRDSRSSRRRFEAIMALVQPRGEG